jgi:predicted nuclease with TOPRIM domain
MKSSAFRKDELDYPSDGSEDANMSEHLEVRVARIESHVEHINEVTTDLRVEQRRTNDKIDKLSDNTNKRFNELSDNTNRRFDELSGITNNRFDELSGTTNKRFDELSVSEH